MSSRRYVKRVWRVPKDRGPVEYLATLVVKALIKHGWPAVWRPMRHVDGFYVEHVDYGFESPSDFLNAVRIAVAITARAYGVEVSECAGAVTFNLRYSVNVKTGRFREVKPDDTAG